MVDPNAPDPYDYNPPNTPPQTPDDEPPYNWLYDGMATPPASPIPGQEWYWNGNAWGLRAARGQTSTGGGMSEADGRAYDQQHGLVGGYMGPNGWVSGSPSSTGGGGGGGGASGTGQFDYGRPMGNQFSPYSPLQYQPFDYAAFEPSNRDMLYDDKSNPGFVRSQQRLQKQIEAGAAYQGVLRSGNTFDRLSSILSNNEESAFKAFDDRRARDYGINRSNKFENWAANLGVAERDNQRANDYRFNTEKATADDVLARWQQLVQSTTALAMPK